MLSRLILPGREEGEEVEVEMLIRLEINSWTVEEFEVLLLFDDAIFLFCLLACLLVMNYCRPLLSRALVSAADYYNGFLCLLP